MSDTYSPGFIFSDDPRSGALTYDQLQARRKIALALATRNRGFPKNIGEGLTYLGESLGEMYADRRLASAEAQQSARDRAARQELSGDGTATPAPGRVSEAPDTDPLKMATAIAGPETAVTALAQPETGPIAEATATRQPLTTEQASQQPSMSIDEWKKRVARNESSIFKDPYTGVGERSRKGDYPYGKYQVMGVNVPKWTAAYLGREMTPKEFLADPEAQEQVATARGSEYMTKYGPIGAAQAWFGGENWRKDPRATDTLGTHVAEYTRRFNIPLVERDQVVASAARSPGAFAVQPGGDAIGGELPPGATPASAPAREDIAMALAQQQAPQKQLVAQAGPAPIPQAPPPVPPSAAPMVTPQTIPPAPVQPARPVAPGEEPQLRTFIEGNPALQRQMETARRYADDNTLSPDLRARAAKRYEELERRANDAYTKQWTVWHERTKAQEAAKLTEEQRGLETTKLRGEAEDAAEKRILSHRLGGQEPQKWFDNFAKEQTTADIAGKVRDDNRIIIKAVRDGVIMGWGANFRLNTAKLASWAVQNGYSSEQAANTEIMRALGGSRIREALSQVNPSGVASNTDLLLARQLSGAEPTMEPKSFMQLLHKSSEYNAKLLNDYEDKKDYYLSGTRAERQFNLVTPPTAPQARVDEMLANRDDKAKRAMFDDTYGEGSSALEIERFKRRQRRGQ